LVDGNDRSLGEDLELGIGDNGRHLNDPIAIDIKPCHLQVDPDEIVLGKTHRVAPRWPKKHPRVYQSARRSAAGGGD
jgi:hypothetical protein